MLAKSVAGELIRSEIEIRSQDRSATSRRRSPTSARTARRLFRLAAVEERPARRHRHPPVEPLAGAGDHRHRALPAAPREPRLRRLPQQHVLGARARRRARRRPRDRRLRPAARGAAASCSPSRPTRRSSTGATRASTRRARRSSPRASRAAGSPTRSASWQAYADYVEFLEATRARSPSSRRSGGACARTTPTAPSRSGSATPSRRADESTALAGAGARLRRPGRARLRRGRAVRAAARRG